MLQKFRDYIGEKDSLSRYSSSYKLVFLISLLEIIDSDGKASFDEVAIKFRDFYRYRQSQGLEIESKDKVRGSIDKLISENIGDVKRLIKENPFKAISNAGFIKFDQDEENKEAIVLEEELKALLTSEVKREIIETLKVKCDLYYEREVKHKRDLLSDEFKNVLENYVEAKKQPMAGHDMGRLVRDEIPEKLKNIVDDPKFLIRGSVGQGQWTNVPWVAIANKNITETIQDGEYITYLFAEDMSRVYLTFMLGVTELSKKYKRDRFIKIKEKIKDIRNRLNINKYQENIILGDSERARGYEAGTILSISYDLDTIDEKKMINDLKEFVGIYDSYYEGVYNSGGEDKMNDTETLKHIMKYIKSQGYTYEESMIKNFYLSLKSKPFVMLGGISGTGKSKLVEIFANAIGCTSENGRFNLVPVKPDWSDSSELIGYKNIHQEFRPGLLTKIVMEASDNLDKPYFLCLDEMNLARVEYYFSDVLSILESKKREDGRIVTDKLIKNEQLDGEDLNIMLPENMYIIGTVNMDETTFAFSKKVLDRGNTIEFDNVQLDFDFDDSFQEMDSIDVHNGFLKAKYLKLNECRNNKENAKKTIEELKTINGMLEGENLHFAYRVRDEIVFYILNALEEGIMSFDQAMDFCILQKILPRVQGSCNGTKQILVSLFKYLSGYNKNDGDYEELSERYKTHLEETEVRFPKSAHKTAKMIRKFEREGFTSYWA